MVLQIQRKMGQDRKEPQQTVSDWVERSSPQTRSLLQGIRFRRNLPSLTRTKCEHNYATTHTNKRESKLLQVKHVPGAWRESRRVFITKTEKKGYDSSKDLRTRSLTSYVLEIIERFVHI